MEQLEFTDSFYLQCLPFPELTILDLLNDDNTTPDVHNGDRAPPVYSASAVDGMASHLSESRESAFLEHPQVEAPLATTTMNDLQLPQSPQWSPPSQEYFGTPGEFAMNEFFRSNGAFRPPKPCMNCSQRRLQCFSLQTTPDNPNPTAACSSCVALFKHCSLAGPTKRGASEFETPQPVVGHLHGLYEEGLTNSKNLDLRKTLQDFDTTMINTDSKRSSSRSGFKTRPLRQWLATHPDHPYPSELDKETLVQMTGLSMTQVLNWFGNARRRQRHAAGLNGSRNRRVFREGSPMPHDRSLLGTSPLSRWHNSPPEEEAASVADIENALTEASRNSLPASAPDDDWALGGELESSTISSWAQDSSSEPSVYLSQDSNSSHVSKARKNRKNAARSTTQRGRRGMASCYSLHCSFCSRTFTKKSDWVRHERSLHLPDLDAWVCSDLLPLDLKPVVWCVGESKPRCSFCGEEAPSDEHTESHEFSACAERSIAERSFYRKDHLWQHLAKFHHCVKWEHWTLDPNVEKLRLSHDAVDSTCGICFQQMNSWNERKEHLVSHFKAGATMSDWSGGHGIHEPWNSLVQGIE